MIRVGFGFDVHQLKDNADFSLGGVNIPHSKGAVSHSDGDALIHAICDALLGAAGMGDIGHHFPDDDPQHKGRPSKFFLEQVMDKMTANGYAIGNLDATICLETPKLAPHIEAMKTSLAETMRISPDDVSIKATTNERMGFIGREEGVVAYAVVLIEKE